MRLTPVEKQLREVIEGRLYEEVEWFARKRLTFRQSRVFLDWLYEPHACNAAQIRHRLALTCSVRTVQRDLSAAIERMALALSERSEGVVSAGVSIANGHRVKTINDQTLMTVILESEEIAP